MHIQQGQNDLIGSVEYQKGIETKLQLQMAGDSSDRVGQSASTSTSRLWNPRLGLPILFCTNTG
jgi:hypothetical protein